MTIALSIMSFVVGVSVGVIGLIAVCAFKMGKGDRR